MGLLDQFYIRNPQGGLLQFDPSMLPDQSDLTQVGAPSGLLNTQPQAAPAAPPVQPAAPKAMGPGFWRTLDGVLAGHTITDVRDHYSEQQRALGQQHDSDAIAARLPDMQRLAFLNNPKAYTDAYAKTLEPYTLQPGEIRGQSGQTIQGDPKSEWNGDQAFSFDPVNGTIRVLGRRDPSHAEVTSASDLAERSQHDISTEGLTAAQLAEQGRHNRADEATARQRAAKEAAGGAGLPAGWVIK